MTVNQTQINRAEIFAQIDQECHYQRTRWSVAFDNANTPNDWVAYIAGYLGRAVTLPWDRKAFRRAILVVAALAVTILERETYAHRHYDDRATTL